MSIFFTKLKCLAVFASLLFFQNLSAQIVINEYSAANWKQFVNNLQEHDDWIELYNTSPATVDISGWSLTDNPDNPRKWVFKQGLSIAGNGFARVWCSGRDSIYLSSGGHWHTNFKLTQTKNKAEKLTLVQPDGVFADQVEVKKTHTHASRARVQDGAAEWKICTAPTPRTSNNNAKKFDRYVDRPKMDTVGGFYKDSLLVSIKTDEPNGVIRYTLDGTEPRDSSPIYTEPLLLKKTTVVKARVFTADPLVLPSFIEFNTYFINVDHTLVVVSIAADDLQTLANGKKDLKPIGSLEYFGKDKDRKDRTYGELNAHGQDSWANDQRSLDWVSRDEFGYSKAIDQQIFQITPRDEYQRIIFRASGDDNYPAAHNKPNEGCAHMRDDYVQALAGLGGMRLDTRLTERCIVYLNGDYWGVYSFRDNPDDHDYTNFQYGQDKFHLYSIKTWGNTWVEYGGAKATSEWNTIRNHILTKNLQDSTNFKFVEDRLDFLSLIDYFVVNTNTVCSDWLNYNTNWWRGLDPAGGHTKWGYNLWDNDATFGFYINYTGVPDTSPLAKPCDIDEFDTNWGSPDPEKHIQILNKLRTNKKFEQLYISRQADMANTVFSCENMLHVLDSMTAVIEPEMAMHAERWFGTYDEWKKNLGRLRHFVEQRCGLLHEVMIDCYDIEGPWAVTFMVDPPGAGTIAVNTLPPNSKTWTGDYFSNMENLLVATPKTGMVFDRWQSKLAAVTPDVANPTVRMTLNGVDTVVAKFKLTSATFDPTGKLGVSVFPTVFQQELNVQLEVLEKSAVDLQLFDALGKPVARFDLGELAGERLEKISLPVDLPSGVYFLQVGAGAARRTLRVIRG